MAGEASDFETEEVAASQASQNRRNFGEGYPPAIAVV